MTPAPLKINQVPDLSQMQEIPMDSLVETPSAVPPQPKQEAPVSTVPDVTQMVEIPPTSLSGAPVNEWDKHVQEYKPGVLEKNFDKVSDFVTGTEFQDVDPEDVQELWELHRKSGTDPSRFGEDVRKLNGKYQVAVGHIGQTALEKLPQVDLSSPGLFKKGPGIPQKEAGEYVKKLAMKKVNRELGSLTPQQKEQIAKNLGIVYDSRAGNPAYQFIDSLLFDVPGKIMQGKAEDLSVQWSDHLVDGLRPAVVAAVKEAASSKDLVPIIGSGAAIGAQGVGMSRLPDKYFLKMARKYYDTKNLSDAELLKKKASFNDLVTSPAGYSPERVESVFKLMKDSSKSALNKELKAIQEEGYNMVTKEGRNVIPRLLGMIVGGLATDKGIASALGIAQTAQAAKQYPMLAKILAKAGTAENINRLSNVAQVGASVAGLDKGASAVDMLGTTAAIMGAAKAVGKAAGFILGKKAEVAERAAAEQASKDLGEKIREAVMPNANGEFLRSSRGEEPKAYETGLVPANEEVPKGMEANPYPRMVPQEVPGETPRSELPEVRNRPVPQNMIEAIGQGHADDVLEPILGLNGIKDIQSAKHALALERAMSEVIGSEADTRQVLPELFSTILESGAHNRETNVFAATVDAMTNSRIPAQALMNTVEGIPDSYVRLFAAANIAQGGGANLLERTKITGIPAADLVTLDGILKLNTRARTLADTARSATPVRVGIPETEPSKILQTHYEMKEISDDITRLKTTLLDGVDDPQLKKLLQKALDSGLPEPLDAMTHLLPDAKSTEVLTALKERYQDIETVATNQRRNLKQVFQDATPIMFSDSTLPVDAEAPDAALQIAKSYWQDPKGIATYYADKSNVATMDAAKLLKLMNNAAELGVVPNLPPKMEPDLVKAIERIADEKSAIEEIASFQHNSTTTSEFAANMHRARLTALTSSNQAFRDRAVKYLQEMIPALEHKMIETGIYPEYAKNMASAMMLPPYATEVRAFNMVNYATPDIINWINPIIKGHESAGKAYMEEITLKFNKLNKEKIDPYMVQAMLLNPENLYGADGTVMANLNSSLNPTSAKYIRDSIDNKSRNIDTLAKIASPNVVEQAMISKTRISQIFTSLNSRIKNIREKVTNNYWRTRLKPLVDRPELMAIHHDKDGGLTKALQWYECGYGAMDYPSFTPLNEAAAAGNAAAGRPNLTPYGKITQRLFMSKDRRAIIPELVEEVISQFEKDDKNIAKFWKANFSNEAVNYNRKIYREDFTQHLEDLVNRYAGVDADQFARAWHAKELMDMERVHVYENEMRNAYYEINTIMNSFGEAKTRQREWRQMRFYVAENDKSITRNDGVLLELFKNSKMFHSGAESQFQKGLDIPADKAKPPLLQFSDEMLQNVQVGYFDPLATATQNYQQFARSVGHRAMVHEMQDLISGWDRSFGLDASTIGRLATQLTSKSQIATSLYRFLESAGIVRVSSSLATVVGTARNVAQYMMFKNLNNMERIGIHVKRIAKGDEPAKRLMQVMKESGQVAASPITGMGIVLNTVTGFGKGAVDAIRNSNMPGQKKIRTIRGIDPEVISVINYIYNQTRSPHDTSRVEQSLRFFRSGEAGYHPEQLAQRGTEKVVNLNFWLAESLNQSVKENVEHNMVRSALYDGANRMQAILNLNEKGMSIYEALRLISPEINEATAQKLSNNMQGTRIENAAHQYLSVHMDNAIGRFGALGLNKTLAAMQKVVPGMTLFTSAIIQNPMRFLSMIINKNKPETWGKGVTAIHGFGVLLGAVGFMVAQQYALDELVGSTTKNEGNGMLLDNIWASIQETLIKPGMISATGNTTASALPLNLKATWDISRGLWTLARKGIDRNIRLNNELDMHVTNREIAKMQLFDELAKAKADEHYEKLMNETKAKFQKEKDTYESEALGTLLDLYLNLDRHLSVGPIKVDAVALAKMLQTPVETVPWADLRMWTNDSGTGVTENWYEGLKERAPLLDGLLDRAVLPLRKYNVDAVITHLMAMGILDPKAAKSAMEYAQRHKLGDVVDQFKRVEEDVRKPEILWGEDYGERLKELKNSLQSHKKKIPDNP